MPTARLRALFLREDGQTMAEYAVVLSVITVALLAAFGMLGAGIEATVERARAAL